VEAREAGGKESDMEERSEEVRWSRLVWGLCLIALGGAFLLDRFGMIHIPDLGRLWPVVLIVIGVTRLVGRRPGSGLTLLLMGGWFLACGFEWLGFTWENSWPLILVAVGAGIIIRALSGEDARRRPPEGGTP
jgi:hypothetical protein